MNDTFIGRRFQNNEGDWYKVVDKCDDPICSTKRTWYYVVFYGYTQELPRDRESIKDGSIKNPFKPTIAGVGYHGFLGRLWTPPRDKEYKKIYQVWKDMIRRCYEINDEKIDRSYSKNGVKVLNKWHNFQTFYQWVKSDKSNFKMNYELDKDIFGDGLLYGPSTCVFVPSILNNLFITVDKFMDLPQGVKFANYSEDCKYQSYISVFKQKVYLGGYRTKEEAWYSFKIANEMKIEKILNYLQVNDPQPEWLVNFIKVRGWTDDRFWFNDPNKDLNYSLINTFPDKETWIKTHPTLLKLKIDFETGTFRDYPNRII